MIHWESPFYFFIVIVLVLCLLYTYTVRRGKAHFSYSHLQDSQSLKKTFRIYVYYFNNLVRVAALVLVIVALCRPQRLFPQNRTNVEAIDIMLVLDVSDSMLIEDMLPENRLEASKKTIEEFVKHRRSDRIGLVVFSGESYTRVPPTLDYQMLLESLRGVHTSKEIKMGTAIGVALANATARLRDSAAKSRVVILLTDGESNSGLIDPESALQIAKGYQIRIYTIGVGRDGQAQLPIYSHDSAGNKIKRYQPIHSEINEQLLGRFASETGGIYYRVQTSPNLQNVFNSIDRLEKSQVDTLSITKKEELFESFLKIAILLYFVNLLLGHTLVFKGP